ncbi:putative transmembrane protein TauE [Rosa chinensis]|uniref:Putative transmembrane protein TauE n=1 Tax=Rosa chinensis TaxID=74649 RepID=A0A2P6RWZ1_ROSCH|nr:sulfite exporter TauE/SafE family protein 3 [Rosa chinensis]PRQ50931.1 putative transmembrane protein TauE [Rosa chinensis]
MAQVGLPWCGLRWSMGMVVAGFLVVALVIGSLQETFQQDASIYSGTEKFQSGYLNRVLSFVWRPGRLGYVAVWPEMEFGWRIVVGTIIGFIGAAFGTVGGVGGGGIFVPMLTLIIGFDDKSSTALSKCMITGGAAATVFYNLRLRHPTLDLPIIDYDLALLFQPMLMLGISIGVCLNVIFAEWMITVLLIIIFLGTSTKAFFKGVESWKRETILKKEVARLMQSNANGSEEVEYRPLPGAPTNNSLSETNESKRKEVSIIENICWKELGLLVVVWILMLALQIAKYYTTTCSVAYWVLNLMQIPVAFGASSYEAVRLYYGQRVISSQEVSSPNWKVHHLILYCGCGIIAGIVGGLLGLGGGFILGPLFLELGVPPQVSSATATFAMTFSASLSVVEYYLLKRFPVPYALYFTAVASVSALVGQHVVRKVIKILGRASIIIFILAATIFVSAISLGGVGIANMIEEIENNEYMGFEDMCT